MANVTKAPGGQPQILSVNVNEGAQTTERNDVNQKKALTEKNNTQRAEQQKPSAAAQQVAPKGVTALAGTDGVAALAPGALAAAAQTAVMFKPLQATEISAQNTPQGISEFALTFSGMEVGKPTGVEIGNPLKDWQPGFKSGAVAPSLVFSPKTFVAALQVAASEPRSSAPQAKAAPQLRDAGALKQERAAAFTKMLGPQESTAANVAFAKLTPAQQAAVAQLARQVSGDELRNELRRPLDAAEARVAKELLAPAASGLLRHQRVGALTDDSADEGALLDGAPLPEVASLETAPAPGTADAAGPAEVVEVDSLTALMDASLDARAAEPGEVVVPSPFLVKLEQTFSAGLPLDLAGVDVMVLAQMVLAQIGKAAEDDLRDVMKEMQESNRKNDQLRAQMQQQREMQAEIDAKLNDRYHQRTSLDPKDPLYINPNLVNFDRFKALQKIEISGTADNPRYGLSPNEPRFPRDAAEVRDTDGTIITQRDVDLANMAGVAPQQMAFLRRLYGDPSSPDAWSAKYPDFESFLALEVGLTTPAPDGVNQNLTVMEWRNANDPVAIKRAMADKFGVSESDLDRLQTHWQTQLSASERGASFESWLTSKVGLVAGQSAQNADRILDFDAQLVAAEAERAASQEERALIREYGLSAGDLELVRQYLSIVNDQAATMADVRSFLGGSARNEDNPGLGLVAGAANHARNREKLQQWVETQRTELSAGDRFPNGAQSLDEALANISIASGEIDPSTGRARRRSLALIGSDAANPGMIIDMVRRRRSGENIGRDNRTLLADGQAQVDAYLATLPADIRSEVAARMGTYVRDYLEALRRGKPDEAKALTDGLQQWVGTLEPNSKRQMVSNYIAMQMVAVGNELAVCAEFGLDGKLPEGSYLYRTGAMDWDGRGARKSGNQIAGKDVNKDKARELLDATLAEIGELTRAAKSYDLWGNTELAGLFREDVREATSRVLSSPAQSLPGGLWGSANWQQVDALLDGIEPKSLRQQVEHRVNTYAQEMMRKLDGAGGSEEEKAALTAELKQFIDSIQPESTRAQVAGYVAMRMAQASVELSVIAGNENTELSHDSFLRKSNALQYGGRVPGGRSFVPGSGYGDWVDGNEGRNAQRKFASLADEWAGYSEGYTDPDARSQNGDLRSLFGGSAAPADEGGSGSGFLASALMGGRLFGAGLINLTLGGATTPTAPAEPDPARLAAAERFRVQVDHSTAQGEHFITREINFAQMAADLDALKDKKDSQSAMSEMVSLRLQMYMDRRQKIMETMSNAFKKSADTQSGIISNMK